MRGNTKVTVCYRQVSTWTVSVTPQVAAAALDLARRRAHVVDPTPAPIRSARQPFCTEPCLPRSRPLLTMVSVHFGVA